MALENVSELSQVLAERQRLGLVFARHAYGMRAWVDLFSERVPAVADPEAKALLAQLVADNARHMLLFRERALAYGVDPDAYDPPPEGKAVYERICQDSTASTSWPATRWDRSTTSPSCWPSTATRPTARTARRSTRSRPTSSGCGPPWPR